jgi:hypothetical protein
MAFVEWLFPFMRCRQWAKQIKDGVANFVALPKLVFIVSLSSSLKIKSAQRSLRYRHVFITTVARAVF